MSRMSLVLRSLFLIGFVIAMPLLALPSVARRLDELLYGQPEPTVPTENWQIAGSDPEDVIHATFDTPLKSTIDAPKRRDANEGLDAAAADTPELAPVPQFPEPAPPFEGAALPGDLPAAAAPLVNLPEHKIEAIRERLEELGADYMRLEEVEPGGKFRFIARMLIAQGSDETRTFEATAANPAAAAEEVLQTVLSWRGRPAPAHVQ